MVEEPLVDRRCDYCDLEDVTEEQSVQCGASEDHPNSFVFLPDSSYV